MVNEAQSNQGADHSTTARRSVEPAVKPERRLRRLATVFERVIELPLAADAAVKILDFANFYFLLASSTALADDQVRPQFFRHGPGTIKLIVGEPGMIRDDMELDRWRLRLPESTRLESTSVLCKNGVLMVIVPKGATGET